MSKEDVIKALEAKKNNIFATEDDAVAIINRILRMVKTSGASFSLAADLCILVNTVLNEAITTISELE